ncbi:hypothetical protein HGRIS_003795 [Hohenbuehelia grisea]|uniref:XLF-like N-terminal domain-containing protein n=1 Tax=Hohenbuehelia grisea TaxID=104357 RepID=A0ABR3JHI8_9AGAR
MEQFSEEHSKLLLSKEWLVKINGQTSTPYLLKFFSSSVDLSCFVLVTDTKSTWAEVLTSNQFARRWRDSNKLDSSSRIDNSEDEEAWRAANLDVLAKAHTLGGIIDMSFEVVESRYSDFAFELECDVFKWRWETCLLGYKASADFISKHLVMPLISVNHLAFASADPVCELSEADLEKAVDKMGRTARRAVDTHVKHAITKPRIATTLRRMTAMFNFIPELPTIFSTAEKPDITVQPQPKPRSSSQVQPKSAAWSPPPEVRVSPPPPPVPAHHVASDVKRRRTARQSARYRNPIVKSACIPEACSKRLSDRIGDR